jgi:hypothetical protein
VTSSHDNDLQTLRDEVTSLRRRVEGQDLELRKLGQVVTEVVGKEFDDIMEKQEANQRSVLRWVTLSISLTGAMLRQLEEQGVVENEAIRERMRALHERLSKRADAIGSDPDIEALLGEI